MFVSCESQLRVGSALGDAFCARHCEAESGGEGKAATDRDEL